MASKRVERIKSIVWGLLFLAAGLGCIYAVITSPREDWEGWGWFWRIVGILVLFVVAWGCLLPNLTGKTSNEWERESTEPRLELDGFTTTYDQNPHLAAVIAGLAHHDPRPAHAVFHGSHTRAWGLRLLMVRLLHDRYVHTWDSLAADSMLDKLVEDSRRDPCWVLVRAYRHIKHRRYAEAKADCALAAGPDPADPTPYVVHLLALRASGGGREIRAEAEWAYAEAVRRAPLFYEAHEQMLHLIAAAGGRNAAAALLRRAHEIAKEAPEGTDEAFLPALAHRIAFARLALHKPELARRSLGVREVAEEIALACGRSFDSPRYVATHRTARLLHTAAALHAVIGDEPRLRGELARAGNTFDLDIWNPFHASYPARAFLEARRRSGL